MIERSTSTVDMLLSIIKNKGYKYDPDYEPSFWLIYKKDPEDIELNKTLKEQKIRNFETLYITGLLKNNEEIDLYIRLKLR